jgi:heme iron utilization protein
MDDSSSALLRNLLTQSRIAALGTLHAGAPFVSLVPVVWTEDFSALLIHISKLAPHTQDILADPRVSVMLAQGDAPDRNPLALGRLSMPATAVPLERDTEEYEKAAALYMARFPEASITFGLGDFGLFRIAPQVGRFVAGFGKTFNLTPNALIKAATGR